MQQLSKLEKHVDGLQNILEFHDTRLGPHFETKTGMGRMGLTGFLLGLMLGVHLALLGSCWVLPALGVVDRHEILCILQMWCMYVVSICVFHFLEFFITAVYQPVSLSYDSFVVAHSKAYTVAMLVCWAEFWVECVLFGVRKYSPLVCWVGVFVTVTGQTVRIVGMKTCGQSFSHVIVTEKPDNHKLVTVGIYQYLRHPAYFGWFYWSIATQLILCNPLSAIAFAAWAWYFFATRIPYEESTLLKFYGEKYSDYCKYSHIGIPFIKSGVQISAAFANKKTSGHKQDKDAVFQH